MLHEADSSPSWRNIRAVRATQMIADFVQRWDEIRPLLDLLFDVPAAERSDWLREHSADAKLRLLVERALEQAANIDVLERDIAQSLSALVNEQVAAPPSIPGYQVRRFVGAGGMASVFEAERELPGGPQTVALKVLRINVHDPDEQQRFLREQRILARLQHPYVAQLLDAGFTPAGTPFLALEFVAGDDLLSYCAGHALGARARLALFVDVCAAVDHAHRNLIVHRDLKPSNVLVGADGCVKLVDFGIAKLLTGDGEETRTEARRLTRRYAAPEQLAGENATTAIDVYALGRLLAELLCDVRNCDDSELRRRLGIDVHAIVRQATQHDPACRYVTVAALREDVAHYLEGKPLQARADTLVYRAIMFAKRHIFAVCAATAVAAILIGATLFSLHETRIAEHAAARAETEAALAQDEARRADAVKGFLEGLFDSAAPGTTHAESAEALLARGRERADRDFAALPALRVELLALVGDLERRSGNVESARDPLEQAATLAARQFGVTDRRTLHVEYLLAQQADEVGRVHDATARLQHAVDAFNGGGQHDSAEEVQAVAWLAGLYEREGDSTKAIAMGQQALDLGRSVLAVDSEALTEAVTNLGWIFMDAGHAERAEPLLREALVRQRERFGDRHVEVADALALLTSALLKLGHYGEGERLLREALSIDEGVYVRAHPHTAWHLNDLANVLALEGKLDEAAGLYANAIAVDRDLGAAGEISAATSTGNLARIRFEQGAYADAEAGMRDAIASKRQLLGADYVDNGGAYDATSLAQILVALGRYEEAQVLIDQALDETRRRHQTAHPDTAFALMVQAELAAAGGDHAAAAASASDAVFMYAALANALSSKPIRARLVLGENLHALGRDEEARASIETALAAARSTSPPDQALVAHAAADLERVDVALGDAASAAPARAEAEAALGSLPDGANVERKRAISLLGVGAGRNRSRH